MYQDLSDNIIQFSYSQGDDSISLFVQDENSEIQNVQVGNVIAEFYRSNDPDSANVLTWASEDGDMMFCITSTFSQWLSWQKVCKKNLKKQENYCPK